MLSSDTMKWMQASSLLASGVGFIHQNRHQEALPVLKQAQQIFSEIGDRALEGAALYNLGMVYEAQGQLEEALPCYVTANLIAIEIRDRQALMQSQNRVTAVLAKLRIAQKPNRESLEDSDSKLPIHSDRERSIEPLKQSLSSNIEAQIKELTQQFVMLQRTGQHQEALRVATQAHDLAIRNLDETHPVFSRSLMFLVAAYHATGNYVAAERELVQHLPIQRRVWGSKDIRVALSLHNLSAVYLAMGDSVKAASTQSEEAAILLESDWHNEADPLQIANMLNDVAGTYRQKGNLKAAVPLLLRALWITQIKAAVCGVQT